MVDKLYSGNEPLVPGNRHITMNTLIAELTHKDRQVRKNAVTALGEMADKSAIEPLISALSRELSRGASSYAIIAEIIIALSKIPDRRALDALIRLESQTVDRGSPQCPTELPPGVITYIDVADSRLRRVLPRELHFKVLDVMRAMSVRLNDRTDYVADRFNVYQQAVIEAEVDRALPKMSLLLHESDEREACQYNDARDVKGNGEESPPIPEPLSVDAMAGIDYDIIRREIEIEVTEYVRDDDKLQLLIQDARRIKAHIRLAKNPGAGSGRREERASFRY